MRARTHTHTRCPGRVSWLPALAAFSRDRPRTVTRPVNQRPGLCGRFPPPIPLGYLVVKSSDSESLLSKFTKIHSEWTQKFVFVPPAEKFPTQMAVTKERDEWWLSYSEGEKVLFFPLPLAEILLSPLT